MVDRLTTITVPGGKQIKYRVILDYNVLAQRGILQKYFVTLRNAIAHRDIAPENVEAVPANLRQYFGPKFSNSTPIFCQVSAIVHVPPTQSAVLNKALCASRITAAVALVTTACNLLRVLKRALRAMTPLLTTVLQWSEFENFFNLLILLESAWFKIHGPRPPRPAEAASELLQ